MFNLTGPAPRITAIMIYPIKSLDGVSVTDAAIRPSGGLRWDREWMMTDADGNTINGKRVPRVHDLRGQFDLDHHHVAFSDARSDMNAAFDLDDTPALEHWLSEFFERPVILRRDPDRGYPDDPGFAGPTVLSEASITEVAAWYPETDQTQIGRRFRANLIVSGDTPFWEDRLIGKETDGVRFQIGSVAFEGVNPCARCIVVTRDPVTGAQTPEFQQVFTARRRETLPAGVDAARFNHFFRLAVNTVVPESEVGKILKVGDEVRF